MDKNNFRKKLGITVALLIIIGMVLCFIGQFGLKDDRYIGGILSKLGGALLIASVVIGGIGMRVFQIKDAASVAKTVYQDLKKDGYFQNNDAEDFIDPVSGALKERRDDPASKAPRYYNSEYPKALNWFYIICLVLFIVFPIIGVIFFNLSKFLAGGLMFGLSILSIVVMLIGNSIIMKKYPRENQKGEFDNLVGIANSINENDSSGYSYSNKVVPVQLTRASISDAEEIWEMQKIAFAELLKKYEDYDTSPANETIDKVKSRFDDPNTYHYFIKAEDKTVGVIRVFDSNTLEKKRLSQIFIMPEYRRNRYAYSALKKLEVIHGSTGWELETILQERYLTRFYMHLGYSLKNKTKQVNPKMLLIYLEK